MLEEDQATCYYMQQRVMELAKTARLIQTQSLREVLSQDIMALFDLLEYAVTGDNNESV